MKYLSAVILMGFLSLSLIIAGCDQIAEKKEITEGIEVVNAYAFATAQNAKTGAVFMKVINHGPEDDTFIGVSSDIAEINEIHESYIDPEDNMMMMRKIGGIDIEAGTSTELEPAGLHIMLIKLQEQLVEGESFKLTLKFAKAGDVSTKVVIAKAGMAPPAETAK